MADIGKYSLIRYDNEEYDIVLSNMVKQIDNENCTVKYKGTRYKATLISNNDNKLELIQYKNSLENMSKVNNGCLSAENYAISTVLTPIAPSSSLSSNINVNTNLIAESTYSNNNFNSSVSTKETSTNILKLNSISSIEHSISNSSLPLSFDQTFQSKLMIHASSTSNCTSLCAITTSSDTSLKKLLQRTLSTSTNITSSSLPSTSDFSGFKQLLPTTYTTALKHTSFASNYISPSTITSDISPKKKLQRPLSTYANINSSSLAPTCSVSGFKQLLPTTYTTPLDQKYFASSYISSSTITTSDISPKNTLQRPLSTCANINSSSLASTLNNITSVKVINSVNNIDDNLSSAESTPIVSDSKFSLERTYSDNISSSSSSNAATPDAKNICENSSSEVLTPIVSASKCSLNRIFSDNVSSSTASSSTTPYPSPKKATSEKLITAINNIGKKLSTSKRTYSEIFRISFSPTKTPDSNLSPAVSSSSTSTTPKKYLNNAGANLPTYVATPIISDAKCSLKRRYYTTYSSSSSPWTTPDASPKKCLVPALPISVSANLPSVGFTNTTNSTSTPDVSSENILFKHISPLKNLPSTTALSTVFNPSLNSSSQETEVNSSILMSSFPTNNSINNTKSTYNTISEYFPDSTGEFLGESTVGEQNRSVEQLVENPLKLIEIKVPYKNQKAKKHFCIFCKTLQTKLARHFFLKHKTEKQIKEILHLPSRSNYRLKVIDDLRKKGDFLHNTSEEHNSGILIVTRQQQKKRKNEPDDYVCCKNCKGFYSKNTIRIHLQKCAKGLKNARDNLISGRKMTQYIHTAANFTIRTKIFPVLRNDNITKAIRYDELIIKYGNKLSEKYTLSHQHDMIRSQLRLLGRFLIEIKKLDGSINELKEIFKPGLFDTCIQALRIVANWDDTLMWFRTPAVAQSMTSIIKKCGSKQRSEFIKTQSEELKKDLENFLLLWEEEIPVLINKKAFDDQCNQKRIKKVLLPSKDDIRKLYLFLKTKMSDLIAVLVKKYSDVCWHELVKATLIFIQIFNRRRPGEIERLTINNYLSKEVITDNVGKEILENMSQESVAFAKQFERLTLRGKLGRTVSVLLSPLSTKAIDIILKNRTKAGITNVNEYIFAKKGNSKFSKQYYRACPLLKQFAEECGAEIPQTLRGTSLRKHIATYTSLLNIEEASVDQLANFMGHHKDIHKNVYRVPVPVTEITCVSKLLMSAIGENDDREDENNSDVELCAPNDQIDSNANNYSTRPISNKRRDIAKVNIESEIDQISVKSTSRRSLNKPKVDIEAEKNQNLTQSITMKKRSAPSIDIESESSSSEDDEHPSTSKNKKRRSTSPYGKTTRRRWSDSEKNAIYSIFGNLKELEKLPSMMKCLEAINGNPALKNRTPQQLKTWLDNQRRHK